MGSAEYVLEDYSFTDFTPGMLVLDLGCGEGNQLRDLEKQTCLAIGIDLDWPSLVNCRTRALRVLQASGEQMPLKDRSLDGLICKVVLPYTDEARVFAEIGRVLKGGGSGILCYHGAGYYLRYLVLGRSWKVRVYGLRAIFNTWFYVVTGRRLRGFVGDTLYQSRQRLQKYYRRHALRQVEEPPVKTFLGFPVFIYHSIEKA